MSAYRSEFSSDEEMDNVQWSNNLADVRGTIDKSGIEGIDDDTLYRTLKELRVNVGPIVDSTRKLYRSVLMQRLGNVHNSMKHRNGSLDDEFDVSTEEDQESEDVEVREEDFDVDDECESEEVLREPIVKPISLHQRVHREPVTTPNVKQSFNVRPSQTTQIQRIAIQKESYFLRNAFIVGLASVLIGLSVMYYFQETWR